jgi:arginine decarboxylase
MSTIRVVWGAASGPTRQSSYDAALADANVHNYNLVTVSSVVPADATVEAVGTAPDLGPAGERLTVVQARATRAGPGHATAGLGWAEGDGPGLFYEAAGETDEAEIEQRVRAGLAAGRDLRDWDFTGERTKTVSIDADAGTYATAVLLAVYGDSEPIC